MSGIVNILALIVFIVISIITVYLAILSIAAKFYKQKFLTPTDNFFRIAIIIPAYKEDRVILSTIDHCINQDYSKQFYTVFVGAHFLTRETIDELRNKNIQVIEILDPVGSKALSIQRIFQSIEKKFDIAFILDADNLIGKDCLSKINQAFQGGCKGVQLHRTAKNLNTPVAVLDAISEEINNTLFRKGNRALKLSSSTIGSGMAFSYTSLRKTYFKPEIIYNPACDREVEFDQLNNHVTIEYLENVYVLDEKVQDLNTFRNQRTRWSESQLWHINKYFKGITAKNLTADHINKFFQNLIPSRILLMVILYAILIIEILLSQFSNITIQPKLIYWIILFGLYHLIILSAIPIRFFSKKYLHIFMYIPVIAWNYILAVTRIRTGRKEFIHTPKNFDETHEIKN